MRTLLLTLIVLLVTGGHLAAGGEGEPPAAAAGTVVLRPMLKKGEAFAYEFSIDTVARRTGAEGAAGTVMKIRQGGVLRLNVLDVDADGVASMSAVVARVSLRAEDEQGVREAKAERVEGKGADVGAGEPEKPPAKDAGADGGTDVERVARILTTAVIRFEVSPTGRVHTVSGLDAASEEMAAGPESVGLALGVFTPASVARMLERLWKLDEPKPDAADTATAEAWPARSAGDEWMVREERRLAYDDAAAITRNMKLGAARDVEGRQVWPVEVKASGVLLPRGGDPDPTVPTLKINAWTEESSALWEAGAGRIQDRRDRLVTDTAASIGARSRGMRLEIEIEVKAATAEAGAAAK